MGIFNSRSAVMTSSRNPSRFARREPGSKTPLYTCRWKCSRNCPKSIGLRGTPGAARSAVTVAALCARTAGAVNNAPPAASMNPRRESAFMRKSLHGQTLHSCGVLCERPMHVHHAPAIADASVNLGGVPRSSCLLGAIGGADVVFEVVRQHRQAAL